MRIAVLTFEGFNELDSFIAAAMINRVKEPRLEALIVCPSERLERGRRRAPLRRSGRRKARVRRARSRGHRAVSAAA
jgi:hypothetical protein